MPVAKVRDLAFEQRPGAVFYHVRRPFKVDGIRYHRRAHHSVAAAHPMIDYRFDNALSCDSGCHCGAVHQVSRPPTEQELDRWVRTGTPPSF